MEQLTITGCGRQKSASQAPSAGLGAGRTGASEQAHKRASEQALDMTCKVWDKVILNKGGSKMEDELKGYLEELGLDEFEVDQALEDYQDQYGDE